MNNTIYLLLEIFYNFQNSYFFDKIGFSNLKNYTMYLKYSILYLILSIPFYLSSQNLVVNGSFEEGSVCDANSEESSPPNKWRALAGAPRFLNPNCPVSADVKSYIKAMQLPSAIEGNVYMGIGLDIERKGK